MDATSVLNAPPADRLTLQALAKEQGVSPVTCWRWSMTGIHGLRMPTLKVGKKRLTSRQLFSEWCRQVTAIANGEAMPAASEDTHREDIIDRADHEAEQVLGFPPFENHKA